MLSRLLNIWLAASLSLFCLGWASQAEAEKQRVAVMPFSGPSSKVVRKAVLSSLKKQRGIKLVPPKQVLKASKRQGVSIDDPEGAQAVGRALNLSAFVEGQVQKRGKRFEATVSVRNAATGEVLHEETWKRPRPKLKTIRKNFWKVMRPHLKQASPPEPEAEPEPEPEEEPVEEATPEPERPPALADLEDEEEDEEEEEEPGRAGGTDVLHPALVLSAGPRLMWRSLSYDGATTLSSYENKAASPAVNAAIAIRWFPGAHTRSDWTSNLGLELDFDYALGLKSQQDDTEVKTTAFDFGLGALARWPLDTFVPFLRLGYVRQVFDADVSQGTPLPGVTYSSIRPGLGTAIHFGSMVSLDVAMNLLIVLDSGELNTSAFAEGLGVFGMDLGGGLTVRIKEVWGMRLGVDYRRYGLNFESASANAAYALPDSGVDSYFRTGLSLVYTMPGAQ